MAEKDPLTFEKALEELESIVARMEEGKLPLEEPVRNVRPLAAKPFPRPQRPRSMAERSEPRGDAKADTPGDSAVIEDGEEDKAPVVRRRLDAPGNTLEERRAQRRGEREARLEAKRQMPEAGRHAGATCSASTGGSRSDASAPASQA